MQILKSQTRKCSAHKECTSSLLTENKLALSLSKALIHWYIKANQGMYI